MERAVLDSLNDAERYRLLLDAITDYAIYMLDAQGRVTSWNPGAERFKGYRTAEILGEHFSRFYTEDDKATDLPARALAMAEKEGRFEGEGWRVKKDGSRFWAHVVIDPVRSASGEVIGYAKVTRDLTERKLAQDRLRKNEEQLRLLVQGVIDYAIYMLDPSGHVASWNAGACRIKGYEPAEIIGEHFSRFYTPEDRNAGLPRRALETARREGRFEDEGCRVKKDGSRFWASVIIDAIHDDDGKLIGFAKVTRDITEKREAQQALEQAQNDLLQSRKMEALGRLAGGIAHDFNNLLMAISGSLDLLRQRVPDDPKTIRLLDNAIQGARRGASLTERMLAFSRRQPLEPKPVDLSELVSGLRDLLQLSVGGNISVQTRAPLSVRAAMVDANQLELALLNIAANARDAMPGGGTLTIAVSEEDIPSGHETGLTPGAYLCLAVSDTGEGMDEDILARAADPFFTTKGPGRGTGLGLSVAHGLLEDSGGRLLLKSRKGEGTRAEMWLPALAAEPRATRRETAGAETESGKEPALTVLAVDDDVLVLMNTVAMLEDLGHRVLEASNGAAALELLEAHQVDLVISDQGMPGMTGLQLAQAVRKKCPELPIIIATGYLDLPRDAALPDLPKLSKPFGFRQLNAAIRNVMASREPEDV